MGQITTVDFRGDELFAYEQEGGILVALKPIVEALGLDWSGQLQRVKRDPVLSEGVGVIPMPYGCQEVVGLRLPLLNGWLFTVTSSRISDEAVRAKVDLYRRECFDVLYRHFHRDGEEGDKPASDLTLAEKVRLVTEARQTFDPLAARELWFKVGLPTTASMIAKPTQAGLFDQPGAAH